MKVNRNLLIGLKTIRPKRLRQRLTEQRQSRQRQASDWLNRKTNHWSKRRQLWFLGGWLGLGLASTVVTVYLTLHPLSTLTDAGKPAMAIVDRSGPIHPPPHNRNSICWEHVMSFWCRLDSLRRLDTGSFHHTLPRTP